LTSVRFGVLVRLYIRSSTLAFQTISNIFNPKNKLSMEFLHGILTALEILKSTLAAIPERKILPFAFMLPIVIFGTLFLWDYIKSHFSNEQTN